MADLIFEVHAHSESPARARVQARNFSLVIDEPPALGGDDLGANPVEYVLAGLTGCLNVVAHLVAKELGIRINGLRIHASGAINPERLLNVSFAERAGYKSVSVRLDVDTDAEPELLDKWRAIVESRCPVSDNLSGATPVHLSVNRIAGEPALA